MGINGSVLLVLFVAAVLIGAINVSVLVLLLVAALVLGAIDGLLAAMDREPDPLDLARPSVERLEVEARRAAEELHQLDRDEG